MLTIEEYAGVTAALSIGIPLSDVLQQEGLTDDDYQASIQPLREQVAASLESQLAYASKLRIAEDCLAQTIDPVEHDASAWVGLLGVLATADDPNASVTALGLSMGDVGRLGRVWNARAKANPEVASSLVELGGRGECPARVTKSPAELRPFPWTPKVSEVAGAPAPDGAESEGTSKEASGIDPSPAKASQALRATYQLDPVAQGIAPQLDSVAQGIAGIVESWTAERYAALVSRLRGSSGDAAPIFEEFGLDRPDLVTAVHLRFKDLRPAPVTAPIADVTVVPRGSSGANPAAELPFPKPMTGINPLERGLEQRQADLLLERIRARAKRRPPKVGGLPLNPDETQVPSSVALQPALPFEDRAPFKAPNPDETQVPTAAAFQAALPFGGASSSKK